MIRQVPSYEVVCDTCGERLEVEDIIGWITEEDAAEALHASDWSISPDGRVECDICRLERELNENTEEP